MTVVVVGSANLDLVVSVARHPKPGETVIGGDLRSIPGGKGANQATATARLGQATSFVGAVGDDDAGRRLRRSLGEAGVDTSRLGTVADTPTGTALITVADDGDNVIVVSPGANRTVSPTVIDEAGDALDQAAVVLLQLEVPLDAVTAAARRAGGLVVLNPAPAPDQPLPSELLAHTDILVPNETELAALTGVDPDADPAVLAAAARTLGIDTVVVTRGAAGALIVTDDTTTVPAPVIDAIDTTAAGDAFCGALAQQLSAQPEDLSAAVAWAVRVGAATALRPGAAPSLPTAAQVDERLEATAP
ncbi:MAG: ribokinase [Acidimicrobiales bacterium]